jgi:hypothetical protein
MREPVRLDDGDDFTGKSPTSDDQRAVHGCLILLSASNLGPLVRCRWRRRAVCYRLRPSPAVGCAFWP